MRIAVEHRQANEPRVDLSASELVPRLIRVTGDQIHVAIIAGGALLIGGDKVEVQVRVGAGCDLVLEDIGGTVAYGGNGRTATWTADVTIEPGGRLRWHAAPFIVADGAQVHRNTKVTTTAGAEAQLRETIVLGRSGERGGSIITRTDVMHDGRPLFREELAIDGRHTRAGLLGPHRVLDTAMSFGRRRPGSASALQLAGPGTIVRALGPHTHEANVEATWARWSASST